MRTFQEIKDNYRFTDPDIETLKGLLPVVEPHVETIVVGLLQPAPGHPRHRQISERCGQAGLAAGAASEVGAGPVSGSL